MSRGLILGHIGRSIGDAGASIGNLMMQGVADEQRRAEAERLKAEERAFRAEQAQLQRDAMAEREAARSDAKAPPLGNVAGLAGLTDPELAAYDEAQKTGDFNAFKKPVGEPGADGTYDAARRAYPPGVDDNTIRAKLKQIAEIRTAVSLGKDNEGYQDGNRQAQAIKASEAALADPKRAGVIGQAMAAGAGTELVGGDSNVTRNKFTGATSVTPVGQSVIRENNAQGARAVAGKNDETLKALTQERVLATNAASEAARELKALQADAKSAIGRAAKEEHAQAIAAARAKLQQYERQRDEVSSRLREFTDNGRVSKPAEPAKKAPSAGGKKDFSSLWK